MFKTELCLKVIGDQAYALTEPLIYNDNIVEITVHPKFDFDGASIPKPLWSVIGSPMTGGYQRAGCLHDALYAGEVFDRAICDQLFLDAMKADKVGYIRRYVMYWAVRSAGWTVWKGHKREEVDLYRNFVSIVTFI